MTMESETRSIIKAALPGVPVEWGMRLTNAKYPLVTLSLISDPKTYTLSGRVNLNEAVIQADIWSASYQQAVELKNTFITDIATKQNGLVVQYIFIESSRQGIEPDEATPLYRYMMTIRVKYRQ